MKDVMIADYGVGNLHSVARAVQVNGANPVLVRDGDILAKGEIVILPGVGAFDHCVSMLRQHGLWEAMLDVVNRGSPVLGICVGMQMLMSRSEEFGGDDGFGLIPGAVAAIPETGADGSPHKIPHTGWSNLHLTDRGREHPVFGNFTDGRAGYFVHSFAARPDNPDHMLAAAHYNGVEICAAIGRDNITGFQFHPEKSGQAGLELLANFIATA